MFEDAYGEPDGHRLLQEVLQTSMDGIFLLDAEGRVKRVNRAAQELFGYRAEELAGLQVASFISPQHRESFQERVAHWFQGDFKTSRLLAAVVCGQRKDGSTFSMRLVLLRVRPRRDGRHLLAGVVQQKAFPGRVLHS